MVAKIGRGQNLKGVLSYNQLKVEKENAEVLFTHKILETSDGHYSVAQMFRSFEPYLLANRKTEKTVLHISINPDPKDNVSDEKFNVIAQEYMQKMGYGKQPFVVFKHTDIERTHIHIVSVCVDEEGRKISDSYERMRSMDVCRDLEKKYGLIIPTENKQQQNKKTFNPVDYKTNDLKSHIASVVRYLPKYYQFQSLGEYNALLSLFNITVEEVKGELHGKSKNGLVYFALNESEEKTSNPFKASLFGKTAGYQQLQNHFEESKTVLKQNDKRQPIKTTIETALQSTTNEQDFKKQLTERGISIVVRRNDTERIYGITFVDHNSKIVWNGSRLGKEFSANIFNDHWNHNIKSEMEEAVSLQTKIAQSNNIEVLSVEKLHHLFDFLNLDKHEDGLIEALGSLLPEAKGEDYEEIDFTNKIKKKRKHNRGQK
ncbi:conjugal transfer protein MobB [Flavobacterium sp.]|uniref:conjugal transfer protein MobB n=1 Tax=Flavobacterium sp. TaxID=239 RepID=UPI003D6C2FE9